MEGMYVPGAVDLTSSATELIKARTEITRLNEALLKARLSHAQDIDTISRMFGEAACANELCGTYEATIDNVNKSLTGWVLLKARSCECC